MSNDHVQDFIYSQCHMHIYLQGRPVNVKQSKVGEDTINLRCSVSCLWQ